MFSKILNLFFPNSLELEEGFFDACSSGDLDGVEKFLRLYRIKPFDLNHLRFLEYIANSAINLMPRRKSRTPFSAACEHGHYKIVERLLTEPGIYINQRNAMGATGFYLACHNGRLDIVELLSKDARCSINTCDDDKETPFLAACRQGHFDIVQFLLNNPNCDINASNSNEVTPFFMACCKGHLKIAKLLLHNTYCDINSAGKSVTPFYWAVCNNNLELVKLFLQEERFTSIAVGFKENTPFFSSIVFNRQEMLQLFIVDHFVKHPEDMTEKNLETLLNIVGELLGGLPQWIRLSLNDHHQIVIKKQIQFILNLITPEEIDFTPTEIDFKLAVENAKAQAELEISAAIFALVVELSDGITAINGSISRAKRFFKIAARLPMEIQMVLCQRVFHNPRDNILCRLIEPAVRNSLLRFFREQEKIDIETFLEKYAKGDKKRGR